jgi:hypothetical protein
LSPDQGRVLLRQADGPNGVKGALVLHDLDSGHQQRLPPGADGPLVYNEFAGFSPCGTRIAFSATDARGALRVYVQDLAGGPPAAIIAAEDPVRMPWNRPFSPDGRSLVLMGVDDRVFLHRLDTGEQRRLPGMCRDFRVVNWTADGLGLFVHRLFEREPQVMRYDLASGTFTPWQALSAPGHVQLPFVRKVCITPDGLTLAYAWSSMRTDLWGFSEADA